MTVDIASLLIPLLLTAAALWALGRRVDVYDALTAGASEGLTVRCASCRPSSRF